MPNQKRVSKSPPERRDGAGHLDRAYAAELHQLGKQAITPEGKPFIGTSYTEDVLAEQLAEQAIETATSGEDHNLDVFDVDAPEDVMSPFRVVKAIEDPEEEEEEEE